MKLFFKGVSPQVLLVLLLALFFLTSCVSQKKIKYIQDNTGEIASLETKVRVPSKIQPNDELYIRVNSFDERTSFFFNGTGASGQQMNNTTAVNLISYTVSEEGFIDFPFVGKLKVSDLTLDEAKAMIHEKLKPYLQELSISVKYVTNTITILGEVRVPGRKSFVKGQLNVFQAIGLAGDITVFGNRKAVVLVREEGNETKFHKLDLTDINVVQSPYYYLKPNDMLIVHPLKQKQWGFQTFPYAVILSSITTFVALTSLIIRL